ncbi:D-inositol-3-phosphate glycosyltransferase [Variibacter gotjawalensis]|uniref:D-inositol-3-phosphate glycosyltransferase n=1 Tax=Variibacter gotjawalensis TaxID=1333996 RepID=A0A0S3PNR6_9BRAD|nr:glycosyltransferase family 4 protein [Variibacter gotjawalensis]NIK47883.1 glycosyltransferase involved in cell wall biosynthesis [Variibacter gotjawalensis]RZS49762.1 glycosyltransferase involved in cell wall biosynthesis [Variibacter gotjawalensis]BAT57591.1 D-inositol-3-phosphate glycosyltransferase [Variibacter gotjawalensis]
MKIAVVSSFVPFIDGGGRFIVEWLVQKLLEHGHQVEKIYLPSDESNESVLQTLLSYRLLNVADSTDRMIAIRPPAHTIRHPNKVVWFIHHMRSYYDLADTPYGSVLNNGDGHALRDAIRTHDTLALAEAKAIFTNSKIVGDRLLKFNGLQSRVLYPPLLDISKYYNGAANDEIVSVCRLEAHKRQDLLVRAMAHVKSPVKLRIAGSSSNESYERRLRNLVKDFGLQDKVKLDIGWLAENEKVHCVSRSLASVYAPQDEDSYGYPTLEAAAAYRPTLTCLDSGGTLEFIRDGENGLIVEPTPLAIAEGFDRFYLDKLHTVRMGQSANATIQDLGIRWDHVIKQLTAA